MKTVRFAIAILAVCLVASSMAQGTDAGGRRTQFAHGQGVWNTRDNNQARIAFRVAQTADLPVEGTFHFAGRGPAGAPLTISSQRLLRLEVTGNVAHFGGPAVLEVGRTDSNAGRRIEGHVRVTLRDNVRIQEGRQWRVVDLIEVTFVSESTDRPFEFAGGTLRTNAEVGVRFGRR